MSDIDSELFIDTAARHAEDSDEPDHEVGDLQSFFRAAFGLLSPEQRLAFMCLDEVRSTLEGALFPDEPFPPDAEATATAVRGMLGSAEPGPKA